jgi:hypothetical protein
MTSQFYELRGIGRWAHSWGEMLAHGFVLGRNESGEASICRTGPFVPRISFPSSEALVIDGDIKRELRNVFTGIAFLPVIKEKIVPSDWPSWNPVRPRQWHLEFGEPDAIIDDGVHSPSAAAEMRELWEAALPVGADGRIPDRAYPYWCVSRAT